MKAKTSPLRELYDSSKTTGIDGIFSTDLSLYSQDEAIQFVIIMWLVAADEVKCSYKKLKAELHLELKWLGVEGGRAFKKLTFGDAQ